MLVCSGYKPVARGAGSYVCVYRVWELVVFVVVPLLLLLLMMMVGTDDGDDDAS